MAGVFVFLMAGYGQSSIPPCRRVEISTPGLSYLDRGQTYYVSAIVHDNYPGAPKLTYEWKLPAKPKFEIARDGFGAAFVASEDLNGLEVSVGLITKLEDGSCRSETNASFLIQFNPGSPLVLDDYEGLSLTDEHARLDNLASILSDYGSRALFVISYRTTDTKASVAKRVRRITSHLVGKRKIPETNLAFVFQEAPARRTTIYPWRLGAPPAAQLPWTKRIEELEIPRRRSPK